MENLPVRRTVTFGDPNAPTAEEKQSMNWHVLLIVVLVGLPSAVCILVTGCFNLLYAIGNGRDFSEKVVLGSGAIAVTLFVTGLPIAAELVRDKTPWMAKMAQVFWFGCVVFSIASSMGFSAVTRGSAIVANRAAIRTHSDTEAALNRAEADLARTPEHRSAATVYANIERLNTANQIVLQRTDNCSQIEFRKDRDKCGEMRALQEELATAQSDANLEIRIDSLRRELANSTPKGTSADPQAEQIAWLSFGAISAEVASRGLPVYLSVLLEIGAAFGISFAAGSVAVLLTRPMQPIIAQPITIEGHTLQDSSTGFESWAAVMLMPDSESKIPAGIAHGVYKRFCFGRGFAPLDPTSFGLRLTDYVENHLGGEKTRKGNGVFYNRVALLELDAADTPLLEAEIR